MNLKRILSLLAVAALLLTALCGCSVADGGTVTYTDTQIPENGYVADLTDGDKSGAFAATADEKAALNTMTLKLENQQAALYMGMYTDIAVLDKATGHVWFSNPDNYGLRGVMFTSTESENNARSPLTIDYYDNSYKATMAAMYAYPDAVDGSSRNQFTEAVADGTFTVTYTLGTDPNAMVYYSAMTEETYARMVAQLETLRTNGEISFSLYGLFLRSYVEPALNGTPYYQMENGVTQLELERLTEVYRVMGITAEDVAEENALTGAEVEERNSAYFVIPVEYRLDGADLLVSVNTEGIEMAEGYFLNRIHLFKTFGSAAEGAEGYLFVPNGAGMLVNNDTPSGDMHTLTMGFFGSDYGLSLNESKRLTAENALPVFGATSGGTALFGIVESGEGSAGLTACVTNASLNANAVWPYFEYQACDETAVGITATLSTMRVFAKKPVRTTFRVRYHFLYGDRADYSGMAAYYRTYLTQTGTLTRMEAADPLLTVEFLGSVRKKKLFLGLPVNGYEPLTTFEEAESIVTLLKEQGVEELDVLYSGMANGGLNFTAFNRLSIQSELGGKSGYTSLLQSLADTRVFAGVNFSRVYRGGSGFSISDQCVRGMDKYVASISDYNPSSGLKWGAVADLVSPGSYTALAQSLLKSAEKVGVTRLYVEDMGAILPADYNENREIPRELARRYAADALAVLDAAGCELTVDGAASYVLPYADKVVNLGLSAQNYRLQYHAVPFLQMVLHGSVSYTGTPMNLESDHTASLLKVAETGAGLYYKLMHAENAVLFNTEYTDLYSTNYSLWTDDIAEQYAALSDLYGRVATKLMLRHQWLSDTLTATVYEDGTAVLVNYGAEAAVAGEVTVPAKSWAVTESTVLSNTTQEGGVTV